MKFSYTIYDLREGTIHGTVEATSEEEASEEAKIAGAERGCDHMEEIEVVAL